MSQIEDLQCPLLSFESNDLLRPMHDSTVGLDGPLDDFIIVLEVDDNDIGAGSFMCLLADANVVIRF